MYQKNCIQCGNAMFRKKKSEAERSNWKFCSKSCQTINKNKSRVYIKSFIEKVCPTCKKTFIVQDSVRFNRKIFCEPSCFRHTQESKDKNSGERQYNWKGDLVKYFGLHQRIRAVLPRNNCEHCGIVGEKNKNGKWSIECANRSGEYKTTIDDWVALCRKCHRKYDADKRKRANSLL